MPPNPAPPSRVLVLDDDEALCNLVSEALTTTGTEVATASTASEALMLLEKGKWDALLTDVNLGEVSGLDLTAAALARAPGLPVVVMTAFGTMDLAIQAIRAGAFDFLNKPFELRQLQVTIDRAVEFGRLSSEVRRLREEASHSRRSTGPLVGESAAIQTLVDTVSRVATADVTVLIQGESGTGKELVAQLLHDRSGREDAPLVAVNCGAMPSELLESELFGHERGAFTGATQAKDGLFVEAGRGTLFLDEVGEMPLPMQVKLLRALEERQVRRVGSSRTRPFHARIVAATNRDLMAEVREGRFREDLFYRLDVVRLSVPPLRDRGTDVLLLAQHFLKAAASRNGRAVDGLDAECARLLMDYPWPGNVRELRNAIERAVALTRWSQLAAEDLPPSVRQFDVDALDAAGVDAAALPTLDELERQYIRRVLDRCEDNKSEAARILGIDRKTLYRKLERYDTQAHDA